MNTGNRLDENRATYFDRLERDIEKNKTWSKVLFWSLILSGSVILYMSHQYSDQKKKIQKLEAAINTNDSILELYRRKPIDIHRIK